MDQDTLQHAILYALMGDNIPSRLTDTSRISCVRDDSGIFVDLDIRCENDIAVDSIALYAVPENEKPGPEEWAEAQELAAGISKELGIELLVQAAG